MNTWTKEEIARLKKICRGARANFHYCAGLDEKEMLFYNTASTALPAALDHIETLQKDIEFLLSEIDSYKLAKKGFP
jgi:hypothetical protein